MQHIPAVSHALWRGTFILKMLDMVPTIQTPGSYHRQDSCLFTVGKSLTGLGSRGGEVSGEEVEVSHWCQWKREISKGLWVASPHQQGQLRLALLTSTTVSAFERVSGVGRSTVVPLYIQWVEPRMFTTPWYNGATSVCLPLTIPLPLSLTHPASCLFFSSCCCTCPGVWQKDRRQCKNFISYTNTFSMLSNRYLPKKRHDTVPHQDVSSALEDGEGKYSIEALKARKVSRNS